MSQGCVTWERENRWVRFPESIRVRDVRAIASAVVTAATTAAASSFATLVTTRLFWKTQLPDVGDIKTRV